MQNIQLFLENEMINENTLFILGAGASCPYGYPTGSELRKEICFGFTDQLKIFLTHRIGARPVELVNSQIIPAKKFCTTFFNSSTKSIDLFLSRNPQFRKMGKRAIIFRICEAEKNSNFREKVKDIEHDWYSYVFEKLTDQIINDKQIAQFNDNNISFITLNYDRSLEHFLFESLCNSFSGVDIKTIKELINKINIIHIYGQVAKLEWQDASHGLPYTGNTEYDSSNLNLSQLGDFNPESFIENIKVIYEERESKEIQEARDLISKAKRIFFLGFGYAKENLEILKIPEILNKEQKIYGTALNFTKKEIESTINIFPQKRSSFVPTVHIENMDCLMLLREFL